MPIALLNKTDLTLDEITEFLLGIDKELSNVGAGEGQHANEYDAFKAAIANFTQWRIKELDNKKTHTLAPEVKAGKKTQIENDAKFEEGKFEGEVKKFLDFRENIRNITNDESGEVKKFLDFLENIRNITNDESVEDSTRQDGIIEAVKNSFKPGKGKTITPTISDGIFANFLVQSFYDNPEVEGAVNFSERLRKELEKTTVQRYENPVRELAYRVYKDNTARYGLVWEKSRDGIIGESKKKITDKIRDTILTKKAKKVFGEKRAEAAAGNIQRVFRGYRARNGVEGIKLGESLYNNLEEFNIIADSIEEFSNTVTIEEVHKVEGETYKSYTLDVTGKGSVTFLSDGNKVIGILAGDKITSDRETLEEYNKIISGMSLELKSALKSTKTEGKTAVKTVTFSEDGTKDYTNNPITTTSNIISSTKNSVENESEHRKFSRMENDDLLDRMNSNLDRIEGMLSLKTYMLREMDRMQRETDLRFAAIDKEALQRQIDDMRYGRGQQFGGQFGGGMMGPGGTMSQEQMDNFTANLSKKPKSELQKDIERLEIMKDAAEEALRNEELSDGRGSATSQSGKNKKKGVGDTNQQDRDSKGDDNTSNPRRKTSDKKTAPAKSEWPKLLDAAALAAYLQEGEGEKPKMEIPFAGDKYNSTNTADTDKGKRIELRQDGSFVAVYQGVAGHAQLAEDTKKLRESLETSPTKKVLKTSFIELRDDNYDPEHPDKNTSYCIVRASGEQVVQSFITAEEFKVISKDHEKFYTKYHNYFLGEPISDSHNEEELNEEELGKNNRLFHKFFIKNCVEAIRKGGLEEHGKNNVIELIGNIEHDPSKNPLFLIFKAFEEPFEEADENFASEEFGSLSEESVENLSEKLGITKKDLDSVYKESIESTIRYLAHDKVEEIIEKETAGEINATINSEEAKNAALKAFTGNPKNDKIFGIDHLFSGKKELQKDLNDLKIPNSIYPKVSSVSISRDVKDKNKVTICFDRGKKGKGDDTAYIDVGKGYYIKVQRMKVGNPGKVGADGKPCVYEDGDIKYHTGEVYKCIKNSDGKLSWSQPVSTKASLGSSIFGNDALINDSSNETASEVRKNIKNLRIISVSRSTEKVTVNNTGDISEDSANETTHLTAETTRDVTKLKIAAFVKGSDQSKAFIGKNTKRAIALGAVVAAGLFSGGVIPVAAVGAIGVIQVAPGVAAAFSAGGPLATFFGSTIPAAFAPGAVFGAGGAAAGFFGSTIPAAFAPGAVFGAGGAAATFLGSSAGIATAVTFGSTALVTGGLYKGVTDLIMQPVKGLKLSGDLLSDSVKKDSNKEKKGVLSKLASTAKDKMDEIKRDYKEFEKMDASDKTWSILRNVTAAPFTITGAAIGAIPVIAASAGSVVVNNVARPIGEQVIGGLRFGGNILKAGTGTKLKANERANIASDMVTQKKANNITEANEKIDQALKGSVSGVLGAVASGAGNKVDNMQKAVSEFLGSGTKDSSSFAKALITAPVSVPVNVAKAGLRLGSDSTSIAAGTLGTVFGTLAVPLNSFIPTFCKPIEQVKTLRDKLGLNDIKNVNTGNNGNNGRC